MKFFIVHPHGDEHGQVSNKVELYHGVIGQEVLLNSRSQRDNTVPTNQTCQHEG